MTRHLFSVAFFLGALAVTWAGIGFIGSSMLALAVTAVIGAVYAFGAIELRQFRQATSSLNEALGAIDPKAADLGPWLDRLHPSLRNAVRLRIEGERVALPGPALTPYLVGLLVMLGMLGTFLGMVVTLNGAVFALEKTDDLQAMRSALSVPVMGLGLAFGTSVAGVAASAMLGLMSALSRRERLQAAQSLDARIATSLRSFSLAYQRQETYKALQQQSQALPQVADRLQQMMERMENMSQQLNQRLLGNQEAFHDNVKSAYTELAQAVDASLRESLSRTTHEVGENLRPVVEAAMTGIAREAAAMHERVAETVQSQLSDLSARLGTTASDVTETCAAALQSHNQSSAAIVANAERALEAFNASFEQRAHALVDAVGESYAAQQAMQSERDGQRQQAWTRSLEDTAATLARELQQANTQTLAQQQALCDVLVRTTRDVTDQAQASAGRTQAEISGLLAAAEDLMRSRIAAEATWLEQHRASVEQLAAQMRAELGALRDDEAARGEAAVARLAELQAALTTHLSTLGAALEAPITRLIQTASEAPRAAAEVIAQLRQEVSNSVARDNALLEERARIMETLNALLDTISHASTEQRSAIDTLVAASATKLDVAAGAFADSVAGEVTRLSDIATHVTSSAVEVSSLSEAFGFAVHAFNEANDKLIENLQRIEGAMEKSMSRSDDQLAYYVAQAREIIDLSMRSQKEIVEQLQMLPSRQDAMVEEVK